VANVHTNGDEQNSIVKEEVHQYFQTVMGSGMVLKEKRKETGHIITERMDGFDAPTNNGNDNVITK
jgi:hypothetical protein